MMRNDDIDDIDLSRHRPSRLPGMLVIGAAVGVAVIAAWIVTPILMSKDSAATASLLSAPKVRAAAPKDQTRDQTRDLAPTLAAAAATPAAPAADTTAAAAPDEPAPAVAAAPAATETTASTPWNAQPWPQSRAVQVATAPTAAPPAEGDSLRLAAVAPQETPAEPAETVPLPRKRPSRLIAASLAIPLPRPRPEIEADPPAGPTAFDLQVERMR
jgi:hypothetical protein